MKAAIHYGEKSYGNDEDAKDFKIKVSRDSINIYCRFQFNSWKDGRGSGALQGKVRSVDLRLSHTEAATLAAKILELAQKQNAYYSEIAFGASAVSLREAIRAMLNGQNYFMNRQFVLATADLRAIHKAGNEYCLSTSTGAEYFSETLAAQELERWNKGKSKRDIVNAMLWRDYFEKLSSSLEVLD